MVLEQKRGTIGRFSHRRDAEHVLLELKKAGFPVAKISMVVKYADCEAQLDSVEMSNSALDEAQEDAAPGMIAGGMLGAIVGCLTGLGMVAVPGVGFIVAFGTTGVALVTTVAGAGIGLVSGALISAVAVLDMASDQTRVAHGGCERDEFLVMVDGTDDEVRRAKFILSQSRSSQVWVY